MKLSPQKPTLSRSLRTMTFVIYSLLLISCSSHRYGAYFRNTNESDYGTVEPEINAKVINTNAHITDTDKTSLLVTLKNEPMLQTDKGMQLNLAHKQVERSKALDQLNKIEMKAIKRGIKEVTTKYRKANNPDNIKSVHEMPRYKYLSWAAGLLLAGILFVALSSSATFLGYLATLAFTAAIVFFILWLVKK